MLIKLFFSEIFIKLSDNDEELVVQKFDEEKNENIDIRFFLIKKKKIEYIEFFFSEIHIYQIVVRKKQYSFRK